MERAEFSRDPSYTHGLCKNLAPEIFSPVCQDRQELFLCMNTQQGWSDYI